MRKVRKVLGSEGPKVRKVSGPSDLSTLLDPRTLGPFGPFGPFKVYFSAMQ
jgi:hypothetical protein